MHIFTRNFFSAKNNPEWPYVDGGLLRKLYMHSVIHHIFDYLVKVSIMWVFCSKWQIFP